MFRDAVLQWHLKHGDGLESQIAGECAGVFAVGRAGRGGWCCCCSDSGGLHFECGLCLCVADEVAWCERAKW